MSTTISYEDTTLTPTDVLGWEHSRVARNVAHRLIGGGVEFTHTPPDPRAGLLQLFFETEADVLAAEELHITAPYIDLASTDLTVMNGRYVVAEGDIRVVYDVPSRTWTLEVGFLEDV